MNSWTKVDVEVNGRRLRYERTGGQKPPLVLVHGFTDSGHCWTRLAGALASDYDVIMPDAYGHGFSARVKGPVSLESMADDLSQLLASFRLESAHFLGHSMGAATAALLAARRPQSVRSLILEDPPWRDGSQPAREMSDTLAEWYRWLVELRQKPWSEALAQVAAENVGWHPTDLETYLEARRRVDLNLFQKMDWSATTAWRETVAAVKCPMLLIYGQADLGGLITVAVADEVPKLAAKAGSAFIENAGHQICRVQFMPYLQAASSFLAQHLI